MKELSCIVLLACLWLLPGTGFADDEIEAGIGAEEAHRRCKAYHAQMKFDDAVRYGERAVELDSMNAEYHLWLGIAYSEKTKSGWFWKKLSNAKKSKRAFERAVELEPESMTAREGLLEFLMRAPGVAGGSTDEARRQAEEILKKDAVRGHLALAYIYQRKEDLRAWERELKSAVEAGPARVEPYLRLGGFYVTQRRLEEARQTFEAGTQHNPSNVGMLYNLGWFYQLTGSHDQASAVFRKILTLDSTDVKAHFYLASSGLDRGDFEEAEAAWSHLVNLDPDFTGRLLLEGQRAWASKADPQKGIEALEEHLKRLPEEAYHPIWTNPHLMMEIESCSPTRAKAHMMIGRLHEDMDDRKQAKKTYEQALELDPHLLPVEESLERLK